MGISSGFAKKYDARLILLWTALLVASITYELRENHEYAIKEAMTEARTFIELNAAYRQWIARLGGVYASTDKVPPNPYLAVPDRDVTTTDGKTLTLVNPAYMNRMVFDIVHANQSLGIKNRLTSLRYINAANAPSDWERKTLQSFEQGKDEAAEVVEVEHRPLLRVMKPFRIEPSCLKCHDHQGYAVGDVRGGLSVAVSLEPYFAIEKGQRKTTIFIGLLFWAVGTAGIAGLARQRYLQEMKLWDKGWRLRTLATTTADWNYWVAENGSIEAMTPSAEEVTGYPPDEFERNPGLIREVVHPDDRQRWQDHLGDMQDEGHREMEFRIVTRGGEQKWMEHVCAPIFEEGRFLGRHVSNRDVTARKRATQAVEQTATEWSAAMDASRDVVYVLDLERRVARANRAFCEMTGTTAETARGKHIAELVHPEGEKVPCPVCQAQEEKRDLTLIMEGDHPNNPLGRPIEVTLRVIRDAGGQPVSMLMSLHDLTPDRELSEEKARAEAQYRTILRTTMDGFLVADVDGRITEVNDAYCGMLGYHREELLKLRVADVVAEQSPEDVGRRLKEIALQGQARFESKHRRKDGGTVELEVSVNYMPEREGRFVSFLRDISERRKLEEQLRHAQKMEAVGRLAGGVAHDFNNMLSAIIGYGSVIKMKLPPDDPQQLNVDQVLEAAERAAKLTHSLLAFSRKQVMHFKPVKVNEVIAHLHKFLRRIIGEDVELTTVLRGDATVRADSGQLEQVLMNLATNARDAMPRGGHLAIETDVVPVSEEEARLRGVEVPGSYVVISVRDTGTGMSDETKKRIFEPFFTTKETGRGTGLGLSIVYGIVKQHKGYIDVSSRLGAGTTFEIYLPAVGEASRQREEPKAQTPVVGGTETVLLAEDDPILRTFFADFMAELGYTVLTAEDGAAAVERFAARKDDIRLCVLDMIMPKRGGLEAFEEIRRQRPSVKVIFMSGYAADELQREGIPAGCGFVQKPVSPRVLLALMRETLDRT